MGTLHALTQFIPAVPCVWQGEEQGGVEKTEQGGVEDRGVDKVSG